MFVTRHCGILQHQPASDPNHPCVNGFRLGFTFKQGSSTQQLGTLLPQHEHKEQPNAGSGQSQEQQKQQRKEEEKQKPKHDQTEGSLVAHWQHRADINPLQVFAVLSGSRLFRIRHAGSIRHTFDKIDTDHKGHITESDLAAFAEAHSLPHSYVRPFLEAVLQHQVRQVNHHPQQQQQLLPQQQRYGEPQDHQQQQDQQQQRQQWQHALRDLSEDPQGDNTQVSFAAFRAFVQSREAGLRQAFDAFDMDGDGHISPEDLCCSLSRVCISCPSGCVLRPRGEVVAQLITRLNVDGLRRVTFPEFRSFFMLLPEHGQLVEYWLSGPAALSCADMGGHVCMQETHRKRTGAPWGHLLAGAVAGAASRTATAPLETLRLAAMAGHLPVGTNLLSAAQHLMAAGGLGALYKGNLVNVLRSAPARSVDFFAFDLFKRCFGSESYVHTFAAAGLAGTLSWVLLYPLEVVRSRITLSSTGTYAGIRHCIATIMATEGPGAFYRGLGASVAAIAPEAAITYGLHDLLKRKYRTTFCQEPGFLPSLACGVAAAWSGQLVAFPLEMVSRRMQMAGAALSVAGTSSAGGAAAAGGLAGGAAGGFLGGPAAGGVLLVLSSVIKEGGLAALYRGLGSATLRLVPSAMISFGAYESIQKLWLEAEAQRDAAAARVRYTRLHTALSVAHQPPAGGVTPRGGGCGSSSGSRRGSNGGALQSCSGAACLTCLQDLQQYQQPSAAPAAANSSVDEWVVTGPAPTCSSCSSSIASSSTGTSCNTAKQEDEHITRACPTSCDATRGTSTRPPVRSS